MYKKIDSQRDADMIIPVYIKANPFPVNPDEVVVLLRGYAVHGEK